MGEYALGVFGTLAILACEHTLVRADDLSGQPRLLHHQRLRQRLSPDDHPRRSPLASLTDRAVPGDFRNR